MIRVISISNWSVTIMVVKNKIYIYYYSSLTTKRTTLKYNNMTVLSLK